MDVMENYVMQKESRKEKSICPNCIHHNLCIAENNQPCFECNRFIDANGVTVQEWISVTERLPERDKEVLLIVHGWKERLYYTGCLHRQEAERSWLTGIESKASDWTIWGFSYLREPIVTHWMPLPAPPKEDG